MSSTIAGFFAGILFLLVEKTVSLLGLWDATADAKLYMLIGCELWGKWSRSRHFLITRSWPG
jgi:hypothetical protein